MAAQRADEALTRVLAGERLDRRERKVAYNGAVGVPIREEVLARHGATVITRNAYGARCLNTPDALFADVDFAPRQGRGPVVLAFVVLALMAAVVVALVPSWGAAIGLLVLSLALSSPLAKLAQRVGTASHGDPEALARRGLTRFITRHPDWSVRIYRTPAGLRLLVTHRPFEPSEPDVQQFFAAVGADPIYALMCRNQQCFRARLTAKPWRIGITTHLRPRPGIWPVQPQRMHQRADWVAAYEAKAAAFAACRFVESVGSGVVHERLQAVVELHDAESRANHRTAAMA